LITSARNPRVEALVDLHSRRGRERSGRMLVEGHDEISLALASGAEPSALYFCPSLVRDTAQLSMVERAREVGAEVFELSPRVFEKVAYRQSPDGWLAEFPAISSALDRLRLGADPILLICERVEKPGNLGAILRTAEAAGVDAVIASPPVTDWGNPNTVRASRGALFAVPVAEAPPAELVRWLREQGLAIAVTSPQGGVPFTSVDLSGGLAIVLGSESHGVQGLWEELADVRVRVPMFGRVNSLNVAATAAILTYEVLRQRGRLA
jgi:TrmH family RNA methyltransferase